MFEELKTTLATIGYNDVVSTASLFVSVIVFLWMVHHDSKDRFRLDMKIDHSDSFYFDAIWVETNSPASLIVSARIINKSSSPITISRIELWNGVFGIPSASVYPIPFPEYLPSPREDITKDENGNLQIWAKDGEGCHLLDINNDLVKTPITIEPYGEVKGLLLFVSAADTLKKTHKTKIRIITSRGNKTFTFKITTREAYKHLFT